MVQDFEEKIWEKEEEARTQDSSLVRLLLGGFGALGVLDADDLLLALHRRHPLLPPYTYIYIYIYRANQSGSVCAQHACMTTF